MSEGITNAACFSITTLLVVSLANLILLIVMILESRKKCHSETEVSENGFRFGALQGTNKYSSLINANNPRDDTAFMAALLLLKGTSMSLICGKISNNRTKFYGFLYKLKLVFYL